MTIINALPFNLQNGTTADATQVMADFNEIVNDVNNNAAHNGVNTDITALSALVTPITPAQGGSNIFYGAGGGTANAQTAASLTPSGFTLTAGWSIYWIPSVSNTGALQLNANSTGLTTVKVQTSGGLQACIGGEVISGQLAKATYDGTQFVLDLDVMSGFGALTNLASATTTDLGTALSHNINITGTTTITAFGSTASLQRPLYKLTFAGALTLTYNATSLIIPGSISITTAAGDTADALYLGSGNWQILNYSKRNGQPLSFPVSFLQNYLTGLTLSYSSTTVFGIAAGEAADSTNVSMMQLNSAYTKTTSAWAVGTGNGGLDTGTIGAASWYHVYLIQRPDTGVVDVCYSLSASSPSLPTNYTLYRRIGSVKTASSQWVNFTQNYDTFIWAAPVNDVAGIATTGSRVTTTLSVPTGVVLSALFRASVSNAGSGANIFVQFPDLVETDAAASASNSDLCVYAVSGNTMTTAGAYERITNASAQIGVRSNSSNGTLNVTTYGWKDTRGK